MRARYIMQICQNHVNRKQKSKRNNWERLPAIWRYTHQHFSSRNSITCARYKVTPSVGMKQYPTQPTSLQERSKFVFLWVGGKSARTIAKEMGVSPSTVCRWISRWREEGNVNNHKPHNRNPYFLSRRSHLENLIRFDARHLLHFPRTPWPPLHPIVYIG